MTYNSEVQTKHPGDPVARRRAAFSVEQIERMVHEFYGKVREDELIGPFFEERIESWPPHLDRMVRFWRAILRSERVFAMSPRGAPPVLHRSMTELRTVHFERWLSLFATVADDVYDPEAADEVKQASARIAGTFMRQMGLLSDFSDSD